MSTAYTYGQYEADPRREAFYVRQLVTTALNGVAALDDAAFTPIRDQIVALVRPTDYARTFGPPGEPTSSIWRPFVGDFIAVLAHDEATQERSLRGVDIQTLGLSEAQAWELAFENLRRRIGPLAREANSFGAEVVTAPSGLAPASLLLPETCSSSGPSFDVYIVTRDTFFYADANKPQASGMLAGYAAQLLQSGDNVYSERLLSCLDGAWYASVFNGVNAWTPEQPDAH